MKARLKVRLELQVDCPCEEMTGTQLKKKLAQLLFRQISDAGFISPEEILEGEVVDIRE
jgi:hypothetical protein